MDESGVIDITERPPPRGGENAEATALFVPNDTDMGTTDNRVAIITGPNMAGKSTYMRQVALIVLMAQIGCFVPAKDAQIGIVDRIFTRIGASRRPVRRPVHLYGGDERRWRTSCKTPPHNSLLILDEIGRGTSTFDGMAIARAVLEYCADPKKLGAKTLFATHYHELTALEDELPGVKNYNIAVKTPGRGHHLPAEDRPRRGRPTATASRWPSWPACPTASLEPGQRHSRGAGERVRPCPPPAVPRGGPAVPDGHGRERGHRTPRAGRRWTTLSPLEALNLLYELKPVQADPPFCRAAARHTVHMKSKTEGKVGVPMPELNPMSLTLPPCGGPDRRRRGGGTARLRVPRSCWKTPLTPAPPPFTGWKSSTAA